MVIDLDKDNKDNHKAKSHLQSGMPILEDHLHTTHAFKMDLDIKLTLSANNLKIDNFSENSSSIT